MLDGVSSDVLAGRVRVRRTVVGREGVFALGLLLEVLIITTVAVSTGAAYHAFAYTEVGPAGLFASVGLLVALLFEMPLLVHSYYHAEHDVAGRRGAIRVGHAWTYAFLCVTVIGFLTKTSDQISRAWFVLFFLAGLISMVGFELAMRRGLKAAALAGIVGGRRLVVVGTRTDVEQFEKSCSTADSSLEIIATALLPSRSQGKDLEGDQLAHMRVVVERARRQGATDIVILSDWPRGDGAMGIADLFLDLPVAVHLGRVGLAESFPQLRVARLGGTNTLVLRREPMNAMQLMAKRALDIAAGAAALILLSPLFLVVGALIKLDSKGPVFFKQRRRGFNHQEFQIWKFRTMTTMDDGDVIVQAKKNDARVTRVGRILRKYNIDELPQLINVVLGTMSLVGPRPHAVAHDRQYEQSITCYARRLNVRPGITGWAQIHGCRGETETDGAMQSRVLHDLYYIENWSVALDLYIIMMTVLSPKAYKNAH